MKRLFAVTLLSLLCTLNILAGTDIIYMNVGDTRTLSFNAPPYIVGTQWTISDRAAVEFVTSPGSTSTMATIKALSPRTAANRVIVHCTYYYRELDPTTGRYEYQRTGYQDWEIIITGSGSSGGGGTGSDKRFVYLDILSAELVCGKSLSLNAYVGNGSSDKFIWTSSNPAVASISTTGKNYASVYAEQPGTTTIRVSISNGAYDECIVTVYSDFMFELNEDTKSYSVRAINSLSGEITIPSSYNGKPVTTIAPSGFNSQDGIQKLNIPNTIQYIGDFAFYKCTNISSVTIPNSVIKIGNSAFVDSGLEKLYFNAENCESCGSYTYPAFPKNLKMVYIGENVKSITSYAFSQCTSLTSVILPNSLTSIGCMAFNKCTGLTSVTIPSSVTSIERQAFSGCTGLESVYYSTTNPIEGSSLIFSDYTKPTLYIPSGSREVFLNTTPWNKFQKIIEVDGNGKPVYTDCLYVAGTLNNWDLDDLSYRLNKNEDGSYQGSICFEKDTNHEFIIAYKNGDKTSLFHTADNQPIVEETSINDTNYRRFIYGHSLTTSDCYNITLPSNWPGGIIDIKVTDLDPDNRCYAVFSIERSNMDGIESVVYDVEKESVFFNLQGVNVGNNTSSLSPGIYIKRQGSIIEKIIIK